MEHLRISIVTTSFNQGAFLEKTIQSVLGQDYPNLEYIIIDGGSTDNSVEIIRKYEKHLAYWVSEKDQGMYHGIQKGFERATGDVMAWINSDDYYHPNSFQVINELFSAFPQIEWVQGIPTVIDERGRTVFVKKFRRWSKYNFLMGDYRHIQQESTFWRRSLWEKAGGKLDTSLRLAGDFELWLRFFDHARLHSLHTLIGAFRVRSKNQLSLDTASDYDREAEKVLKNRLAKLSPAEKSDLKFLRNYYRYYSRIPFVKGYFSKRMRSIYDYPGDIGFDRVKQQFTA
jgi:glycosyltransferase involved in cell wall biosynthesis